jgi:hypothetical protein
VKDQKADKIEDSLDKMLKNKKEAMESGKLMDFTMSLGADLQ